MKKINIYSSDAKPTNPIPNSLVLVEDNAFYYDTNNQDFKLGAPSSATTWSNIAGKPAVVAEGADQATARASIGAGTSSLVIGTTATTAMAGNTPIPAPSTWANIAGKPAFVAEGATATAARTALGLGTAATTASTAYATASQGALADTAVQPAGLPTWTTISGKPTFVAEGASASAARTSLGLGTAATTASSAYATAAQGILADTAIQPVDLNIFFTSIVGYDAAETQTLKNIDGTLEWVTD